MPDDTRGSTDGALAVNSFRGYAEGLARGEDRMIETERLVLRPWKEDDVPEFVRVTNTPAVMEYLGGVRKPEEIEAAFSRVRASQAENGFAFGSLSARAMGRCSGSVA